MKKYIGVKYILARPCTAKEATEILNRIINIKNADSEGNGYLVEYDDGYQSWSPKEAFENAYFECGETTHSKVVNRLKELV